MDRRNRPRPPPLEPIKSNNSIRKPKIKSLETRIQRQNKIDGFMKKLRKREIINKQIGLTQNNKIISIMIWVEVCIYIVYIYCIYLMYVIYIYYVN